MRNSNNNVLLPRTNVYIIETRVSILYNASDTKFSRSYDHVQYQNIVITCNTICILLNIEYRVQHYKL